MNAYALRVIINIIYIPLEPMKPWRKRKRESELKLESNLIILNRNTNNILNEIQSRSVGRFVRYSPLKINIECIQIT